MRFHHRTETRVRAVVAAIGVATFALSAAACSSPAKEYDTPSSLCGVEVPSDLLEPLLPAGKEVSTHPTSTGGTKRCRLHVDGKEAFSATTQWWEEKATMTRVATDAIGVDPGDKETEDHRYIYSNSGAVGLVDCPDQPERDQKLFASVRVTHSATESQVKKLITAYSEAVAASGECSTATR